MGVTRHFPTLVQTRRYDIFVSKQIAAMIDQSAVVETMTPQEQAMLASNMALSAESDLMQILSEDQIKRWVQSAAFGAMADLNITQSQVSEALTKMQTNLGSMQSVVASLPIAKGAGGGTDVSGFDLANIQEFMEGG